MGECQPLVGFSLTCTRCGESCRLYKPLREIEKAGSLVAENNSSRHLVNRDTTKGRSVASERGLSGPFSYPYSQSYPEESSV